jgi:hypothetical protein
MVILIKTVEAQKDSRLVAIETRKQPQPLVLCSN